MPESINHGRRRFIATAIGALGAARLGVIGSAMQQIGCAALALPDEGSLPSVGGATQWLNSPPLTSTGLRDKVVLVDFWTYTCVNWLRTLPYVRAWDQKYRDQGLVVIGVHTPEFAFEKDIVNVRWALKDMDVNYAVAVDNDYTIWRAFKNNYWPAAYIADGDGRIRFHHFGEGAYDETEKVIQRLLKESGRTLDNELVRVTPRGLETAADYSTLRSPETYLGYERGGAFASLNDVQPDGRQMYAFPPRLALNQWGLSGNWTVKEGSAVSNEANAKVVFRFHARDVNLVMGPWERKTSLRFRVAIDGQTPGLGHGVDVDEHGNGRLTEQRTYQLIRQQQPIQDRQLEIQFLDAGAEAFAFTFG
jgi:thiol-disulfide isomerase/thioredoxin